MADIPLQQNADPNNPRTALSWLFVALPNMEKTGPLLVPPVTCEDYSKRFYDAGVRHHPELQKIAYYPPPANHNWIMGSAGHWGPIGEDVSPEVTAPDISHLTVQEKAVLYERLKAEITGTMGQQGFAGVVE